MSAHEAAWQRVCALQGAQQAALQGTALGLHSTLQLKRLVLQEQQGPAWLHVDQGATGGLQGGC